MDFSQAAAYNPNQEPQRPYVKFEWRATEDRTIPSTDGVTQLKNVAWAIVRAPGSKDSLEKLATDWLDQLKVYAKDGRVPQNWPKDYRDAYDMWVKSGEIPIVGTAIKTWPPLTPSQRQMVLNAGILTVEDLANANDENRNRIGMTANNLQSMARTWIEESRTKGATAKELDAMRHQVQELATLVKSQSEMIEQLKSQVKK